MFLILWDRGLGGGVSPAEQTQTGSDSLQLLSHKYSLCLYQCQQSSHHYVLAQKLFHFQDDFTLSHTDLRQFYSLTLREQSYLLRILVKHVVVVRIFYVQKSIHWSKMGRKGSGELSAGSLGPFEYSIPSLKWARKIMLFPFFPLSLQRFKSDTSNKASSAYNSVLIHHLQQLIL